MAKISALSAATALDGTEQLPTVQAGATVRTTAQDIANRSGAPAITIEFTADANLTLTDAQAIGTSINFTDSPSTLTVGRDVVFPAHFPVKFVKNSTAQTLTLKKSGQAGVTLTAGASTFVASGATDVEKLTAAGSTQGKHAVPIMAGSMSPSNTGGCAVLATVASAANQPDIISLDFDAATEEYAQFAIPMPKSWNEGTITAAFRWSHAATATNFAVVWAIQAVAVSDDDPIAAAYGTPQTVTDVGGTTNDLYVSAETPAITIAGIPAAQDTVYFRVYRKSADAADTLAVDARLHSVMIYLTTDADTDV